MYEICKHAKLSQPSDDEMDRERMDVDSNNNSIDNLDNDKLKLDHLNDYVLFEMFNHLPINDILAIKLINKRFYFLVENHLNKLSQVMIYVHSNYKRFETCREHRQTELNCINSVDNMQQFLNHFLIKLTKLKVLNLCFLTITECDLDAFTNLQCVGTTLVHLEISRCKFKNFYLTGRRTYDRFFEKLGDKLQHFIFYKNSSYIVPMNYLLKAINQHLVKLTTLVLDLKQFENFTACNEYLDNCTYLKQLNFHGLYWPSNPSLDRYIAKTVCTNKPIEYLDLKCLKLSQSALFYIIRNCPKLKVLKFPYDFNDDNKFGRQLITSNCVFSLPLFQQCLDELREDGKTVAQFTLASSIASLKQLEELHLNEIISRNVNIDPLILYLYHHYKRNNLRKLVITNYEIHLMNLKAFCYVSRRLEVLSLNHLDACCYKTHLFQLNEKFTRTVNDSFANTLTHLFELRTLCLNQCNFDNKILKSLLSRCGPNVVNFSFLLCKQLKPNCIDLFIIYANSNADKMITVRLDDDLIEHFENANGPLFNVCPPNLTIRSDSEIW